MRKPDTNSSLFQQSVPKRTVWPSSLFLPLEQYVHIRIQRLLPAAAPELWRPKSLVKCRLLLATSQDVKAWKWIEIFKDPTWSKSDWNQSDLEEFCKSQFSCNTRASRLDSIALVPWLLWLVEVLHKGPPADRECTMDVEKVSCQSRKHMEVTETWGESTKERKLLGAAQWYL